MTEESLFDLALNTPAAERGAMMDRECAGKPELRQRVEALLRADAQPEDVLPAQPMLDRTETFAPVRGGSERPGVVIAGKYKLLQQIGEGGMGSVWMADQTEPVKRRVAVKLIRVERGNSQTILARFEAERQAIALMDHPHIARLLDAGTTDDGSPFFVMELVKGVPLTEFCDAHKLSVPERLMLFQQICAAVQHAHQKGIIHRDLKPTNILVESHDDKPVPKVIDFGLAKATSGMQLTEHTLFTALGTVAGTPLYMAPEQAKFNAIDVDTRADIYSLGVILYELLTGTTPIERESFKKAAFDEMLRVIREQDPPTPSKRLSSTESKPSVAANRRAEPAKLGRFVKGELDWIVMKALAKERDRRYETANGFAKDVERFLNHEPVQAGPPSVNYRLMKFVRRNRVQVIAASLVLLAVMAGLAGTTIGLLRALAAEDVAKLRYEDAEKARAKAAASAVAELAERKKAEKAEAQTLADYRASTGDAIEQLIGSKPKLGMQERAYLEKTLKRWEEYAARQGDDEHSRDIRGEGHFNVAVLWQKLGDKEKAQAEFQSARAIKQSLVNEFPHVPVYQLSLANTRHNLAVLLADSGDVSKALTEYKATRDIKQELVRQYPTKPSYQQDLARTHNNLGHLLDGQGSSDEARVEYEAGRDIQAKLVVQFPNKAEYQQDLARILENLGILFARQKKFQEAKIELQEARDNLKKLCERFPAMLEFQEGLANNHHNLGVLLTDLKEHESARAEYQAAFEIRQELARQFPAIPAFQQSLAHTQRDQGVLLAKIGENENARLKFLAAREIQKKLVDQFPDEHAYQDDLVITLHSLGKLLAKLGKDDESRAEHLAAIDLQKKLAHRFPDVAKYQINLGGSYCNFGIQLGNEDKTAESLEWFDRAVQTLQAVQKKVPGDSLARQYLRNSHYARAQAYHLLKKYVEAVQDWDRAIDLTPPAEQSEVRASRGISQLQVGMGAKEIAEIGELIEKPTGSADEYYVFACFFAVASGKIADKQQVYAERAMKLLQQAVKAGFDNAAHMRKDADVDPLREREDFKKLLAELEQK
ncbi:MAG: protein kinase domain-containing protein [Pirellulaceae bacterium]